MALLAVPLVACLAGEDDDGAEPPGECYVPAPAWEDCDPAPAWEDPVCRTRQTCMRCPESDRTNDNCDRPEAPYVCSPSFDQCIAGDWLIGDPGSKSGPDGR